MIKLIRTEFLKLKPYWPFWILAGLYFLVVLGLSLSSKSLLDWWSEQGVKFGGILPSQMPIFDFVDIWQNLTWIGRYFFPLLAFLVIISINNEMTFNTLKQNIIDGMSRPKWVISKILLLVTIGISAGILHFLMGLLIGFQHSSVTDWDFIVMNLEFIPAYMLQLICYLSLAMLLTVWIRKSILSFGVLILLSFPIELLIREKLIPDSMEAILPFFPINGMAQVIHFPLPKYIFMEVQNYISFKEVAIAFGQTLLYWFLTFRIIKKRDL